MKQVSGVLDKALRSEARRRGICSYHHAVLEIGFESVQQKHLDKTIFDQQIVIQCYTCTCSLVNKCIINYVNQLDLSDSAFLITIINLI